MEPVRFSHAYILVGPLNRGEGEARRLAKALLCASPGAGGVPCGNCPDCRKAERGLHPDLLWISRRPDDKGKLKREIYVDQIREIAASAPVLPNEAGRKVYVVMEAGTMNPAAQNAFLKLLEDPPPFDAFLLVTENANLLLETVRSRCRILRLEGEEETVTPEAKELAERFLGFVAGRARVSMLGFAKEQGELLGSEELGEFIRALRLLLADMLCGRVSLRNTNLSRPELMRLEALAEDAGEYLRFNVGTKHILGMLAVRPFQDF